MFGAIFDFNGTLFFDSKQQVEAWQTFTKHYIGRYLTDDEFRDHVHGQNNADTISYILGEKLDGKSIQELGEIKDMMYREACISDSKACKLAPGATEFLTALKEAKIPRTIATGSRKNNVDFYFTQFHLENWFDYDQVVYDDDTVLSKPSPDFFIKAMEKIGVTAEHTVVFEDSVSGINGAFTAGAKCIVGVSEMDSQQLLTDRRLSDVIHTYTDNSKYVNIDFLKGIY